MPLTRSLAAILLAGGLALAISSARLAASRPSGAPIPPLILAKSSDDAAAQAIQDLNRKFLDAGRRMDNPAVMALWTDDAVDLLPGMRPLVGKKAIGAWLDGVTAQMRDYKLTAYDIDFQDLKTSGDWAFEWGTSRQTVQPPGGGKAFENPGKILLILHREADGAWKFREEMWNSSPAQQ